MKAMKCKNDQKDTIYQPTIFPTNQTTRLGVIALEITLFEAFGFYVQIYGRYMKCMINTKLSEGKIYFPAL